MNSEKRRHEHAAPERARHLPEDEEKENRVRRVEQHIGEVMPARAEAVELAVQHVGKPGERVPVRRVRLGERPDNSFARQPAKDLRILIHIRAVIEIDELVMNRLAENQPNYRGQTKAEAGNDPAIVWSCSWNDCDGPGLALFSFLFAA